jgi:glycosyltransferase involved in cell wall biosynthesis
LQAWVRDHHLTEQVRFLGPVARIPELLALSDLGVLASNSEGSSNALAEYLLSGLPVVVADIPANRELLGPDYPFYYPPATAAGPAAASRLAQHLAHLLQDPALRRRTGAANRRLARAFFDNERNFARYAQLLENILTGSKF